MDKYPDRLIGKGVAELGVLLGTPDCEYPFRQGICQLYPLDGNTLLVELAGGFVRNAMHISERREAVRFYPPDVREAFIRVSGGLLRGHIADMSVKSVAFQLSDISALPVKGSQVQLCTNLQVKQSTRAYIQLVGEVFRVGDGGRLVVMLKKNLRTMSRQYYVSYIEHKVAMHSLGNAIVGRVEINADPEVTIIQSDRCLECQDKYCGVSESAGEAT